MREKHIPKVLEVKIRVLRHYLKTSWLYKRIALEIKGRRNG